MKTILLTQSKVAFVDDADYAALSYFKWCATNQLYTFYALTSIGSTKSDHRPVYMHRLLLRPAKGFEVHHIDGNGLNNQRSNLALLTRKQHRNFNGPERANTTGFKGVGRLGSKFLAQIGKDGRHYYLGLFKTPEEAALAYDRKALELFNGLTYLNFPAEAAKLRERNATNEGELT